MSVTDSEGRTYKRCIEEREGTFRVFVDQDKIRERTYARRLDKIVTAMVIPTVVLMKIDGDGLWVMDGRYDAIRFIDPCAINYDYSRSPGRVSISCTGKIVVEYWVDVSLVPVVATKEPIFPRLTC